MAIIELAKAYPEQRITTKTLQRIEAGDPVSAPLAKALCDIYGADFAQVAPDLVEERDRLLRLLSPGPGLFTSSWGVVGPDLLVSHAA